MSFYTAQLRVLLVIISRLVSCLLERKPNTCKSPLEKSINAGKKKLQSYVSCMRRTLGGVGEGRKTFPNPSVESRAASALLNSVKKPNSLGLRW